jgi:phage terminase large subunit-like protein
LAIVDEYHLHPDNGVYSALELGIKPNKKKSSNKIDPAVSALMAIGTFQAEHEDFVFETSVSHKKRLARFNGI